MQEAAYFATLRHEIRQSSYLLGRYAAKLALSELFSEPDLQAIEVVRGVFEQPILQYPRNSGYGVTISHAGPVAVARSIEPPLGGCLLIGLLFA